MEPWPLPARVPRLPGASRVQGWWCSSSRGNSYGKISGNKENVAENLGTVVRVAIVVVIGAR